LQRDERRIDAHKFPLSPRCTWHIGHFLLHHQCDDESTLFFVFSLSTNTNHAKNLTRGVQPYFHIIMKIGCASNRS
jgi:hypothetical protein